VPFAGASGELGVAMDSSDSSSNTIGHVTTPGINLTTNSVTLVSWVFSFTNQINPSGVVFLRDNNNANVFGSQVGAGQSFDYTWANNSATYNYGSGLVVPTNIWALTALAITPSNATLYCFSSQSSGSAVNGVTNPPQSFAAGFALGADGQAITSNRTFNGKMDEVAVFNYTMSASQLQQLYTAAITLPVNPNPTNIVFSAANNQITLSWPADHTGWQLQAQTNKVSVGISTNWVNVSGTTVTNKVVVPVNLTNGTVFYRLVYP
jgi:Concanavalin A-like lectin/glucanases superfamily